MLIQTILRDDFERTEKCILAELIAGLAIDMENKSPFPHRFKPDVLKTRLNPCFLTKTRTSFSIEKEVLAVNPLSS
jgi:hypothetical protein